MAGQGGMSLRPNSAEIPARWLHVILFSLAFTGWLTFILACAGGPVWSPDGSQILFAYRDVENSRTSVALYDRTTGTILTLLSQPASKEGEMALRPAWQKNGRRALVSIYRAGPSNSSEGACELVSIPVKSSVPVQVYNVGPNDGCINPYPEVGGKVYFSGRDLRWLNLESGEAESKQFKIAVPLDDTDALVYSEGGGQIYYQRKATRRVNAEEEVGREIGRVQLEDASVKPLLTIWDKDIAPFAAEDLYPILWVRESTMALIAAAKEKGADKILLVEENKGVTGTVAPDLGVPLYKLGNLVWSLDGRQLYASVITMGDQKDTLNYGVAEIPIGAGKAHLIHIAVIQAQLNEDFVTLFQTSLPVSLSPDGRWIAATPAVLGHGQIEDRDRALFLIDLHDPARAVQRIAIPKQPASERITASKP